MASNPNNPTFNSRLRSIRNSDLFYDSLATFPNDNDPTELPVFFRSPSLQAIAGLLEHRRAAGLLNLSGLPLHPEYGRRALVVGSDRRRGYNLRTRQLFHGSLSTPSFIGQLPITEENSSSLLTLDEQEKALRKLKKSIYNPGPKRFARRLSLYYRNNATSDIKEMENDEDEDGKRCAVCLEDLEPGELVAITPCNHMFHEDCIIPWLKSHGKCPVCRFAL